MLQTLRSRRQSVPLTALVAALSAWLAAPGQIRLLAQETPAQGTEAEAAPLSSDQLDALVAPIALYPDPLLAQCLAASTYPLDIVDAQQWIARNPDLKGDELADAIEKQQWDPSVQALAQVPDALKRMSEDIQWTTNLGDAFLAQQNDVMQAVQRLRAKAREAGKLDSSEHMNVETTTSDGEDVVVIEPTDPEVVYVPSYSPTVIWGPMYYPYPPIYYPPYYGGAWLGFGVGIAIGIGISNGWVTHWGSNNTININNNNRYVNHYNRENNVRNGSNNWQHNPQQRGAMPYRDSATASRYGGTTRQGDSFNRGGGMSSSSRVGSRDVSPSTRSGTAFGGSPQSGNWTRSTSSRGASSMGGMRGGMRGGRR